MRGLWNKTMTLLHLSVVQSASGFYIGAGINWCISPLADNVTFFTVSTAHKRLVCKLDRFDNPHPHDHYSVRLDIPAHYLPNTKICASFVGDQLNGKLLNDCVLGCLKSLLREW